METQACPLPPIVPSQPLLLSLQPFRQQSPVPHHAHGPCLPPQSRQQFLPAFWRPPFGSLGAGFGAGAGRGTGRGAGRGAGRGTGRGAGRGAGRGLGRGAKPSRGWTSAVATNRKRRSRGPRNHRPGLAVSTKLSPTILRRGSCISLPIRVGVRVSSADTILRRGSCINRSLTFSPSACCTN